MRAARGRDEVVARERGGARRNLPLAPPHLDGEVRAVQLADEALAARVGPRQHRVAVLVAVEDLVGAQLDADPAGLAELELQRDR